MVERTERVAELFRDVVAATLVREAADERLKLVSISHVMVSPDLQHAKLYWTHLDPAVNDDARARKQIQRALSGAEGFLKRAIAVELKPKYTPSLTFVFDEAPNRGRRMEEVLAELEIPSSEAE